MNAAYARQYFRNVYGADADLVGSAPGRVNLIGEHTDYNGGQVLPLAIDRRTCVAIRLLHGGAGKSRVVSEHESALVEFDIRNISRTGTWSDYVTGVCAAFVSGGAKLPQIEVAVTSDVPAGSGLSSSAALELGISVALSSLTGNGRTLKDLALLSWRVENQFVGVASGVMDQFASALGEEGCALHLWCDTLQTEQVNVDEALLIFDTALPRSLRSSQFNERRAECEQALGLLRNVYPDLTNLAAIRPDDVRAAGLPELLSKRALHVAEENLRVEELVKGLKRSHSILGDILYASHESLRTKYECSTPELDWFVARTHDLPGVTGARLTGAGWGGCAIAVGRFEALEEAAESLCPEYEKRFKLRPRTWLTRAAPGARLEEDFG